MKKGINSLIRNFNLKSKNYAGIILAFGLAGVAQGQSPDALNDTLPLDRNSPKGFTVTANDIIPNPANTILSLLDSNGTDVGDFLETAYGTITAGSDNITLTYTPMLNFEGIDTITYRLCDGSLCDDATILFQVGKFPVLPIANQDDRQVLRFPSSRINNVLANDVTTSSPDNLSIRLIGSPSKGSATLGSALGDLVYTPNSGEAGLDTVRYELCDNFPFSQPGNYCDTASLVIYINTIHTSGNESGDQLQLPATSIRTQNYLLNNLDVDGDVLTLGPFNNIGTGGGRIVSNPSDNTFTYTPAAGFIGIDTLTYTVVDDLDPDIRQMVRDTIFIEVLAAIRNEKPQFDALQDQPYIVTTDLGTDGQITILASDPEGGSLTLGNVTGISSNRLQLNYVFNVENNLSFPFRFTTPSSEVDTFTIEVCEYSSTALPQNCVPLEVIVIQRDTAKAPVATDDLNNMVLQGGTLTIDLFQNDILTNSAIPAVLTSLSQPIGGTITLDTLKGLLTYTGNPNFFGTETLTYTLSGGDSTSSATIGIEVTRVFSPVVIQGVSPNGDGVNDVFNIEDVDYELQDISVKIFNRWGNLVFEEDRYNANDPNRSWSGQSLAGDTVVDGHYFYIVEIPSLNFKESDHLLFIRNK